MQQIEAGRDAVRPLRMSLDTCRDPSTDCSALPAGDRARNECKDVLCMSHVDFQPARHKIAASATLMSDRKPLIDISLASVADKTLNAFGCNRVPFTGPMNVLIEIWLMTGHEAGVHWLEQCHAL